MTCNFFQENVERPSDAYEAPMDILEFVDHSCNTFLRYLLERIKI